MITAGVVAACKFSKAVLWQESGPVHPWEGSVTTFYNRQIGEWNEKGYGAWIHTSNPHLAQFAASTAWSSGPDFKRRLLDYPQTCCLGIFMRDSSEGRVYLNQEGQPQVAYTLNDYDRRTMVQVIDCPA